MSSNRRRSTNNRRRSSSNTSRRSSGYGRKTLAEARIEHITWGLLVGVFAIIYLASETEFAQQIPNWFTPVAGALILLGSGFYQYAQGWRVSPITWIGGALMFTAAYYGLYMNPGRDLNGIALLVFAGVIVFGVITGET